MLMRRRSDRLESGAFSAYAIYFSAVGSIAAASIYAGSEIVRHMSLEASRQALENSSQPKVTLSRIEKHERSRSRIAAHVPAVYAYRAELTPEAPRAHPAALAAALDAAEAPDRESTEQIKTPKAVLAAAKIDALTAEADPVTSTTAALPTERVSETSVALTDAGPRQEFSNAEQKSAIHAQRRGARIAQIGQSVKRKPAAQKNAVALVKSVPGSPSKVAVKNNKKPAGLALAVQRTLKSKRAPRFAETPAGIMLRMFSGVTS